MKNNKIKNTLIWGGGLRSLKIYTCLNKLSSLNKKYINIKNNKIKTKYVFDTFIKKLNFEIDSIFSNKSIDLNKIIKNCSFFVVAVGAGHGKARYLISKELYFHDGKTKFDFVKSNKDSCCSLMVFQKLY